MEVGAIISASEAQAIRKRLDAISRKTTDRRVREQCRLIACTLIKAGRRVARQGTNEPKLF